MFPEPFVSRAKAPLAKRNEKGYGDENGYMALISQAFQAHDTKSIIVINL